MALVAPVGTGSTSCSVQEHRRSVLFQLQRLRAMQERSRTPAATVPASGGNAGAFCASGSTVTASKSVPGLWLQQHLSNHPEMSRCSVPSNARAFYCSSSTSDRARDQSRSVVAPAAPVCSVGESCRSSSCDVEQVQNRYGAGFAGRSDGGFVTWNKSRIVPGQDLTRFKGTRIVLAQDL